MRGVSVGIEFLRQWKVGLITFPGANVLQTHQDLLVRTRFLIELVGRKSQNLESSISIFSLKIVQAPEMVGVASVGGRVDNQQYLSSTQAQRRDRSRQILKVKVENGGCVVVIWMTEDLLVTFVNTSGE